MLGLDFLRRLRVQSPPARAGQYAALAELPKGARVHYPEGLPEKVAPVEPEAGARCAMGDAT